MLIRFNETTGVIVEVFSGVPPVEADEWPLILARTEAGERVVMSDAALSLATTYVASHIADPVADQVAVSATFQPRPTAAHGWPPTGTAPLTLDMTFLPTGTTVTALNENDETATTSDPADPIMLQDPETYQVRIDPPWPYLPENMTIEVT